MKGSSTVWSLFLLAKSVLGDLVGYGIWPYEPACAFACDLSLSSLKLSCSDLAGSGMDMDMDAGMTSPQCRASNRPWLMTLSWCISLKCAESEISTSELEAFWEEQSTGDSTVAPKWSYSTTLSSIAQPPSQELTETDDTLNFTALVNPFVYEEQYNALTAVQRENVVGSGYGYNFQHSVVTHAPNADSVSNIGSPSLSPDLAFHWSSPGWPMYRMCQAHWIRSNPILFIQAS